jgi:muramoyltetrapeptide carboxypeptidase LdcA involved in peptidoglycan recycling
MDCYLFAPAGTFDPAILNQRMARLQQYFALVHYSPMPTAGYFAGSLSDRVAQIQQALRLIENKGEPAWLMAVRGGYGAIDLLPQIPDLASDTPIVLSGFSDISVLLNTWGRSDSVCPRLWFECACIFCP